MPYIVGAIDLRFQEVSQFQTIARYCFKVANTDTDTTTEMIANTTIDIFVQKVAQNSRYRKKVAGK